MVYLRRAYHSPTLFRVEAANREETNRVIRKKMKYKEFFLRVTLVNDTKEKDFYFGQN